MSSVTGANLPELMQLKRVFEQQGNTTIPQLVSAIDRQLPQAQWTGGAATRFQSAWNGEFKASLKKLQTALHEAATEIGTHHGNIDAATR